MYGGSLYDLAAEEGLETRILDELDEAAKLIRDDPEYLRLLSTPSIPKKERCALLDEAFRGQVHLYVLNFLKILCENGTLRELPGCARAYRIRYNAAHGILEATAITAIAHDCRTDRAAAPEAGDDHREEDRPGDQGRPQCAGRHPAGHRGHRAGRHSPEPAGHPAAEHRGSNVVNLSVSHSLASSPGRGALGKEDKLSACKGKCHQVKCSRRRK